MAGKCGLRATAFVLAYTQTTIQSTQGKQVHILAIPLPQFSTCLTPQQKCSSKGRTLTIGGKIQANCSIHFLQESFWHALNARQYLRICLDVHICILFILTKGNSTYFATEPHQILWLEASEFSCIYSVLSTWLLFQTKIISPAFVFQNQCIWKPCLTNGACPVSDHFFFLCCHSHFPSVLLGWSAFWKREVYHTFAFLKKKVCVPTVSYLATTLQSRRKCPLPRFILVMST